MIFSGLDKTFLEEKRTKEANKLAPLAAIAAIIPPPHELPTLPDEIWIKIFHMLSMEDLFNASLTCKEFHQLVLNSARLMSKMKFEVHFPCWTPVYKKITEGEFKITRKYQHVKLSSSDSGTDNEEIVKLFHPTAVSEMLFKAITASCSSSLTILSIRAVEFQSEHLLEMLSNCRQLQSLTICQDLNPRLRVFNVPVIHKPFKMPSLKKIYLTCVGFEFFNYLKCSELDVLTINNSFLQSPVDALIRFLNKLSRLDSLTLQYIRWDPTVTLEPKFHWKKLEMSRNTFAQDITNEARSLTLDNFETLGRSSCKNATIKFDARNTDSMAAVLRGSAKVTEIIFEDILELVPRDLPIVKSVKKLTLNGRIEFNEDGSDYLQLLEVLMGKFVNLKHLVCIKYARFNCLMGGLLTNRVETLAVTRNSFKSIIPKGARSDDDRKFFHIYCRLCHLPIDTYTLYSGNKLKPVPKTVTKSELEMKYFDRVLSLPERVYLLRSVVAHCADFEEFYKAASLNDWIIWMQVMLGRFDIAQ